MNMIAVTGNVVKTDYAQLCSANKLVGIEIHVVQDRGKHKKKDIITNSSFKNLIYFYAFPEL